MRGLFFASVSHDLKSPLNSILGFTEIVRRSEFSTEGQEESLAVIERSGREFWRSSKPFWTRRVWKLGSFSSFASREHRRTRVGHR